MDDATLTAARPSRRAVTRAAAWSVPVVAAAATAPAYAASCHDLAPVSGTVDWAASTGDWWNVNYRWSRSGASGGVYTLVQNGADNLTVTVSASYPPGQAMTALTSRTMRVDDPVGGTGLSGLCLAQYNTRQTARSSNRRQDHGAYTFTFSRPATNLEFRLADVDSASGDYLDMVELSSPNATFSEVGAKGNQMSGNGSQALPYTATGPNTTVNDATGGGGTVRVRFNAPVSSFTITYWNDVSAFTSDTTQAVWVSDMSFSYSPQSGC